MRSQSVCTKYKSKHFTIYYLAEGDTLGIGQLIKTSSSFDGQKKMKKGTVKFFNEARGFGFIKDENGQEVFVHATGLNEDIAENDNVSYDTEEGKKGLSAVNVSLI